VHYLEAFGCFKVDGAGTLVSVYGEKVGGFWGQMGGILGLFWVEWRTRGMPLS